MKLFRKIALAIAAPVAAIALTAIPAAAQTASAVDRIVSAGKIVIAVQNDVPPYSQIGATNEVEGLDIDIAKAIAHDLGVELELVVVTGANRVPTLVANRADMVIATLAFSPQRAAAVAFSNPYTSFPMVMIAPKSTQMSNYEETDGKVIGLTRGTLQDEIVTRNAPKADIRRYDDDATVIQALVTGQIDATTFGASVFKDLVKRFPDKELERKFDAYSSFAGIAMRRSDTDLIQWTNTWIFYNRHTGFLNALHQKWLGIDLPDLN